MPKLARIERKKEKERGRGREREGEIVCVLCVNERVCERVREREERWEYKEKRNIGSIFLDFLKSVCERERECVYVYFHSFCGTGWEFTKLLTKILNIFRNFGP